MSVSFVANRQKLLDAYNDVLNDKTDTDWALFSYTGNQNELKLECTGDEGLEELEGEFNNGKIMYAFVRIDDPNTKMKKYILIVWQGDGVPATRKGACANHVKDVNRFFKGSHLMLYARNDDDITPEEIMRQVTKSTSNFSYVAPKEEHTTPKPVGSVYKRINPEQEIKSSSRDSFWLKAQKEEDARKVIEKKKEVEKRQQEAMAIKEREAKSEQQRNKLIEARQRDISEKLKAQKLADSQADIRAQEKKKWEETEKEQEESLRDLRRSRRTNSIEHAHEAEQLVSQRSNNPRAMWAQREKETSAPPPQRKYSSSGSRTSSISEQPEPVQQQYQPEPEQPSRPEPAYQPEPEQPSHLEPAYQPEPEEAYHPEPSYEAEPEPSYQAEPEPVYPTEPEQSYQQEPEQSYQQEPEKSYQQEPESYHEQEDSIYSEPPPDHSGYQDQGQHQEDAYATVSGDQQPANSGLTARALYDYQAEDETEITFDPGDMITEIEQIDDGWWRGKAPNGGFGLFPANYVELV